MKRCTCILLIAAGLAGAAAAQPSIYYLWKHKTSGTTKCEPDKPGPSWERVAGPFSDENCRIKHPE